MSLTEKDLQAIEIDIRVAFYNHLKEKGFTDEAIAEACFHFEKYENETRGQQLTREIAIRDYLEEKSTDWWE